MFLTNLNIALREGSSREWGDTGAAAGGALGDGRGLVSGGVVLTTLEETEVVVEVRAGLEGGGFVPCVADDHVAEPVAASGAGHTAGVPCRLDVLRVHSPHRLLRCVVRTLRLRTPLMRKVVLSIVQNRCHTPLRGGCPEKRVDGAGVDGDILALVEEEGGEDPGGVGAEVAGFDHGVVDFASFGERGCGDALDVECGRDAGELEEVGGPAELLGFCAEEDVLGHAAAGVFVVEARCAATAVVVPDAVPLKEGGSAVGLKLGDAPLHDLVDVLALVAHDDTHPVERVAVAGPLVFVVDDRVAHRNSLQVERLGLRLRVVGRNGIRHVGGVQSSVALSGNVERGRKEFGEDSEKLVENLVELCGGVDGGAGVLDVLGVELSACVELVGEPSLNGLVDEEAGPSLAPRVATFLQGLVFVDVEGSDLGKAAEGRRSTRSTLHPHGEGRGADVAVSGARDQPEEEVVRVLAACAGDGDEARVAKVVVFVRCLREGACLIKLARLDERGEQQGGACSAAGLLLLCRGKCDKACRHHEALHVVTYR